MAQGFSSGVPIDTDITLATNSHQLVASQKATKSYVDNEIVANAPDLTPYATTAAVAAGYQPLDTQLTSLAGLSYAGNASKYVRVNAGETGFELNTVAGGGDVVGPASSGADKVVLFDGLTGKLLKDSGLTLSGSNTGDQTSIVGISGTIAQFNTACSDADFATGGGTVTGTSSGTNTGDDKTAVTGLLKGNGTTISAASDGTDYYSSSYAIPAANIPNGIMNLNSTIQTLGGNAGTYYYIGGTALTMPASSKTGGGMTTSTMMQWRFKQSKTAAGTGAYNIRIYRGTNGSTADTADVTQSIGTATAAVDQLDIVITLTVTATGASGSYTWCIATDHKAASAAGFGCTAAAPYFAGTVSGVAMNTASLKFGIAYSNTTGTAVIQTAGVVSQVYGMT
jgi:hypothetical protein